ncbi:hypothetical protein A464_3587 [Salmonella bongori N268-08]|uniref:Uncharacterized protein n=1 Tax=Salmonella bongori N268-08 TaxID=1197719 RepID=S5MVT6_SALBN|nr:hypothetical protein A464_3587 [Salmonella bongori N268-08]
MLLPGTRCAAGQFCVMPSTNMKALPPSAFISLCASQEQ